MKHLTLVVCFSLAIIIAGCGKPSIKVNRDANTISKVAIVSVYSNSGLYKIGGGGGLTALASFVTKKSGAKTAWGGTKLVTIGHDSFATEIDKVGNIEIVPTDSIINSQAYNEFVEDYKTNARKYKHFNKHSYAAYPGMTPVTMGPRPNRNTVARLSELANALNVDAVAIVQIDTAYDAWMAAGGFGNAKASVAVNFCLVNKDGNVDVSTPWEGTKGKGMRQTSTGKSGLVANELIYTPKTEEMFREAINKNAVYFRDQLAGK